jgi:hypothetical protein
VCMCVCVCVCACVRVCVCLCVSLCAMYVYFSLQEGGSNYGRGSDGPKGRQDMAAVG